METLWSKRGYFIIVGNAHVLVYYPIISYQRIWFYRSETMDMVRLCCNNGDSVKWNPSKFYSTYYTGEDIFIGFVRCWTMPRWWHIAENLMTHQIIHWLTYDLYQEICNVYDGILSHKFNKRIRCGDSILCLTYYSIIIISYTD